MFSSSFKYLDVSESESYEFSLSYFMHSAMHIALETLAVAGVWGGI